VGSDLHRERWSLKGGRARFGRERARSDSGDAEPRLEYLQSIAESALYLTLEETLCGLLDRIRTELDADTAAVLLLDDDRGTLVARAARGLEEEVRQGVRVPLGHGFAGRVAEQARPIVIDDITGAEVVNPVLRRKGVTSIVGVPIRVEGRVIGVMHMGTLAKRSFTDSEVSVLQLAADRAALAIDTARLSEQRVVTEIMQRTLLPDALPQLPGLRMSAKYLPAGSGVRIGGDWYDVFHLDSGRLVFVIGDVVGRGVLAASVMAEIRTGLRAYLMEGHELPTVMSLLNDLLVSMGRDRSATAAILELDQERAELEAVSAGHPPALLLHPDGDAQFLAPLQGLPLGVSADAVYSRGRYPFPVGSALLLYTDGLVERRDESIDAGFLRLRDVGLAAAAASGEPLAERVYASLIDSASREDDIALLAIESVALGRSIEMTLDAHPRVLAGLRSILARWLSTETTASEDQVFDMTLAASEAAANAIEHAYGARRASFDFRAEHTAGVVRITIADRGRWRPSRPYGRGRGLAIMRALVDSAEIRRGEGGTTVELTMRAGRDAR
jgi:serine phosphatase RsbU (regulator of sigma subunit)/anti-sigma regulatory factor (Ser/Thr protein kinase)